MNTVQLQDAWMWDCPHCRTRNVSGGNFAGVVVAPDGEEASGEWVLMPEEVTCSKCLTSYTVDFPEEES